MATSSARLNADQMRPIERIASTPLNSKSGGKPGNFDIFGILGGNGIYLRVWVTGKVGLTLISFGPGLNSNSP
jgi:hypothetical protein